MWEWRAQTARQGRQGQGMRLLFLELQCMVATLANLLQVIGRLMILLFHYKTPVLENTAVGKNKAKLIQIVSAGPAETTTMTISLPVGTSPGEGAQNPIALLECVQACNHPAIWGA